MFSYVIKLCFGFLLSFILNSFQREFNSLSLPFAGGDIAMKVPKLIKAIKKM